MSERIDDLAKQLAGTSPRRNALMGLGALALGSLGALGFGQEADAKSCKKKCKRNCKHNRKGKTNKQCRNHCQNKCKNRNN